MNGRLRFEYFLAEKLGFASPRVLRSAITHTEMLEWMAYYEFESKFRETAMRHPKWEPEKCLSFLRTAYRIAQQNKEMMRRGNTNS